MMSYIQLPHKENILDTNITKTETGDFQTHVQNWLCTKRNCSTISNYATSGDVIGVTNFNLITGLTTTKTSVINSMMGIGFYL